MIERKTSATHEITREADDLFIYRFGRGEVTGNDVEVLAEVERKVWPGTYIYSVTLLDDDLSITPGALTRAAKIFQPAPPRTAAFVVRRHYLRTAMEFLIRTVRVLGGQKIDVQFFRDEQEARAWIDEKRRQPSG